MSKIEWTQKTWNPVTGCTKVSAGCKNCYAERMANRLKHIGVTEYKNGFQVACHPHKLDEPKKRKKPTVWFVNSMSDLFHESIPEKFVDDVIETCRQTPRHIYQILTKRPEAMRDYFKEKSVPNNVWLGVSVENRKHGVPRIDVLRQIKCAPRRFLSCEPLLEDLGNLNLSGIDWVICGGESGPGARPMNKEWVMKIRWQAGRRGISFFFKQWGAWGEDGVRRDKAKNGRTLNGHTYDEMPMLPYAFTDDHRPINI